MNFDSWNQLRELCRLVIPLLPDRRKELSSTALKATSNRSIEMILTAANPANTDEIDVAASLKLTHTKGSNYKVVKSVAKARLQNSCFNLDLRKAGYSRYFQDCYRNDRRVFLAKILTSLGARQSAHVITASAFRESERLEQPMNAIETATILRQAALLAGNRREHSRFTERIQYWMSVKKAELELEAIYDQLRIAYSRRAVARAADLDRARAATEFARQKMKQYQTVSVTLFSYRILTFQAQMEQEYRRCIELCKEAEALISSRPTFSSVTRLAEFAIKRLVCAIHLRSLADGRTAAEICETAYKPGTNNWYVVAENHFLLLTACARFREARELWDRTVNEYNFLAQPETRKDRWAIFGLYLQLIEGTLTLRSTIPFSKSLKFKDLLSQVPAASVDKAGYNFALVILHILYLIQQRDWKGVLERIDAIKAYRIRHLRAQNSQAGSFLQLLIQLEQMQSGTPASNTKSKQLVLGQDVPLDSSVLYGLQIIPFDHLWKWLQHEMQKQSTKSTH